MSLEKRDPIRFGGKNHALSGRFKLILNRDPRKFFVANLDGFVPKGKTLKEIVKFHDENGERPFLLITKLVTFFDPDKSDVDAANVAVLIQHPEVRLLDMSEKEQQQCIDDGIKKGNPEYTLINIDKQIMDDYDASQDMIEFEYLIKSKKSTLNKKRLMYISGALNLPTRSEIQDEKRYIAHLQNQLIGHLRGNEKDREMFSYYYDKINDAEVLYFIDEFIKMGIIEEFGGMYKLDTKPLGFEIKNIKDYFATAEDEFAAYKLKVQEYHNDKVTS